MRWNDEPAGIPEEVAEALRLQDEAMLLLDRLRIEEPYRRKKTDAAGDRRRTFRRWPAPDGVSVEVHNGEKWCAVAIRDIGVGGAFCETLPSWMEGPAPVRLKAPSVSGILGLADIMWRDGESGGVRFDFLDPEERQVWSDALIDALLARHAL